MRIIAGTYRGLRLRTLRVANLRPTTDQLRETLFDVLGPSVEGSTFLDAYAGTGAVGIEAISRGARDVVFIEHHRAASQLIRQNLAALEIDSGYALLTCTCLTGLERLEREGERFDVIFPRPALRGDSRVPPHAAATRARLAAGAWIRSLSPSTRAHGTGRELPYPAQTRLLRHGDAQLAFYRLLTTL